MQLLAKDSVAHQVLRPCCGHIRLERGSGRSLAVHVRPHAGIPEWRPVYLGLPGPRPRRELAAARHVRIRHCALQLRAAQGAQVGGQRRELPQGGRAGQRKKGWHAVQGARRAAAKQGCGRLRGRAVCLVAVRRVCVELEVLRLGGLTGREQRVGDLALARAAFRNERNLSRRAATTSGYAHTARAHGDDGSRRDTATPACAGDP